MILMSEVIVVPSNSSVEEGEIVEYEEGEIIDDDDGAVVVVNEKKSELNPKLNSSLYSNVKGHDISKSYTSERNCFPNSGEVDNLEKRRRRGSKVTSNNFRKFRENKFSGTSQKRGSTRGRKKRNHSPYRSFSGKEINNEGDDENLSYDKQLEEYLKIKTKQKELERAEAEAAAANDVDMRTMPASIVSAQPIVPPAFEVFHSTNPMDKNVENWADDVDPDSWEGKSRTSCDRNQIQEHHQITVIESRKCLWKDNKKPPWIKNVESWNENGQENTCGNTWTDQKKEPWLESNQHLHDDRKQWTDKNTVQISDINPEQWPGKTTEPWAQPPDWNAVPPVWQFQPSLPWPPWQVPPPWNLPLPWTTPLEQWGSQCQQNSSQNELVKETKDISKIHSPPAVENPLSEKEESQGNIGFEGEEPLPPGVDMPKSSPKKPLKVAFTIKQPSAISRPSVASVFEASLREDASDEEQELQLRIEALRSAVIKRRAKYRERRGGRITRWNDPDDLDVDSFNNKDNLSFHASSENDPIAGDKTLLSSSPCSDRFDSAKELLKSVSKLSPYLATDYKCDLDLIESPASPDSVTENDNTLVEQNESPEFFDKVTHENNSINEDSAELKTSVNTNSVLEPLLLEKQSESLEKKELPSSLDSQKENDSLLDKKKMSTSSLLNEEASVLISNPTVSDSTLTNQEEISDDIVNQELKQLLNHEDESDEMRLRRLALLSFQRRRNALLDTDESSQNSGSSLKEFQEEKRSVRKLQVTEDEIWDELYIDQSEEEISYKEISKDKDDWDEIDEDLLRAELLRHLANSLPKNDSLENKESSKSDVNVIGKEQLNVDGKPVTEDPKNETRQSVAVRDVAKVDSRPAAKVDSKTAGVSRDPEAVTRTAAAKEADRLCQEWTERMVPRLIVSLDNSDSESESDTELTQSVDQMLLEARLRSDFAREEKPKVVPHLKMVKPSSSKAPVSPLAVRHLPEKRLKEYMLLKKMLAMKEQQILAKRRRKALVSQDDQNQTVTRSKKSESTELSDKIRIQSVNLEAEDTLLIDESKITSPKLDADVTKTRIQLAETKIGTVKPTNEADKENSNNPDYCPLNILVKNNKEEAVIYDKGGGNNNSSAIVNAPVVKMSDVSDENKVPKDLNDISSQESIPQLIERTEIQSSTVFTETTKISRVTSSKVISVPTIVKDEKRDCDGVVQKKKQLSDAVKQPAVLRTASRQTIRPTILPAAEGPLCHRMPATVVRTPMTSVGVISKRRLSTAAESAEQVAKHPRINGPSVPGTSSGSSSTVPSRADNQTTLQQIRSTVSLAMECLSKAAADCNEWGRREAKAKNKIAEAQRQLKDAQLQLSQCIERRNFAAKSGMCYYTEALKALRLWNGLSRDKDKERIDMTARIKMNFKCIEKANKNSDGASISSAFNMFSEKSSKSSNNSPVETADHLILNISQPVQSSLPIHTGVSSNTPSGSGKKRKRRRKKKAQLHSPYTSPDVNISNDAFSVNVSPSALGSKVVRTKPSSPRPEALEKLPQSPPVNKNKSILKQPCLVNNKSAPPKPVTHEKLPQSAAVNKNSAGYVLPWPHLGIKIPQDLKVVPLKDCIPLKAAVSPNIVPANSNPIQSAPFKEFPSPSSDTHSAEGIALSNKNKSVWDDPDAVLCPFQLSGTCRDDFCSYKHISH